MSENTAEAEQPKLAYEVSLDLPGMPKGELVQIPGLGTFENGTSFDVTEEQANAYRVYHQRVDMVYDEETNELLGSEASVGPTLLQAYKNEQGVDVAAYGHKNEGGDN